MRVLPPGDCPINAFAARVVVDGGAGRAKLTCVLKGTPGTSPPETFGSNALPPSPFSAMNSCTCFQTAAFSSFVLSLRPTQTNPSRLSLTLGKTWGTDAIRSDPRKAGGGKVAFGIAGLGMLSRLMGIASEGAIER